MSVAFRADVVGSLVPPAELQEARGALAAGSITSAEFKAIEDRAVDAVVAMQEDAGLDVVTDGELRRTHFAGPLVDACDGFDDKPAPDRPYFDGSGNEIINRTPRSITAPLRLRRASATEEYTYARARATRPVKVTLPAPTGIAMFWSPEHSREAYPDPFDLFADAEKVLHQHLDELGRLGCRHVQFDAPELANLVDFSHRDYLSALGIDPERMLVDGTRMLNDLAARTDISFSLHLCKGSKLRGWGTSGGYEVIARRVFGEATNFDAFLLEYDDERSGSFEPLEVVPHNKAVVLGLVSTRRPELEPVELLRQRVDAAARYFPREQYAISTQCGFASGLSGDAEQQRFQRQKLTRVAEAARELWPDRQPAQVSA